MSTFSKEGVTDSPWLLELEMGLSFSLQHTLESIIILSLLTADAAMGHTRSRGSQKAVELLATPLPCMTVSGPRGRRSRRDRESYDLIE